uniref:ShKT domain-containing protein n=1 Tax=Haemonchus contortus TaxID=6289 RepID=A0A7I4XRS3_HAECO
MARLLLTFLVNLTVLSVAQIHRHRVSLIYPGMVRSRTFSRYKAHARGSPHFIPVLDSSKRLPCCQDESSTMCKTMRTNDPEGFSKKCNTEPDFSLVLCCKTCNDVTVNYRERGAEFFNRLNDTSVCFDRMSKSYCSRFNSNVDTWSTKRWSCNSEHFRLAFRVCRQSCGFCTMDWRNSPDPLNC